MRIAVIDVGSNSVRLMLWADGKTLLKKLNTTRLGEGLNASPYLNVQACERTAKAVAEFVEEGKTFGAQKIYVFATAAVRSCKNPELFCNMVRELCGVEVDIVDGEREAEMGLAGALGNSDGGIIDVGGASTEVTLRQNGKIVYTHSANVGTVRILDAASRNLESIKKFISEKIMEYGKCDFSNCSMFAVGGTASRLAAVKLGLKQYDSGAIHGTVLTAEEIHAFAERFTSITPEEIRKTTLLTKSADLIGGGAELLASVMDNFNLSRITVSESDNLEGYLLTKI